MQPLIYQGKQLKLHQRATCLLELLKKAQARQSSIETDLTKWRGATVVGGGAVATPVYSDGTNWKVG